MLLVPGALVGFLKEWAGEARPCCAGHTRVADSGGEGCDSLFVSALLVFSV